MKIAYLDTHVATWLAQGEKRRVSTKAFAAIERYDLRVSPIVRLELEYIWEVGRLKQKPGVILDYLREKLDVQVCQVTFESICIAASKEAWTRDVFDRMIVAHARSMGGAYLISADGLIAENYSQVIW